MWNKTNSKGRYTNMWNILNCIGKKWFIHLSWETMAKIWLCFLYLITHTASISTAVSETMGVVEPMVGWLKKYAQILNVTSNQCYSKPNTMKSCTCRVLEDITKRLVFTVYSISRRITLFWRIHTDSRFLSKKWALHWGLYSGAG